MEKALLTTLAAAGGFLSKSLWDLYWKRHQEADKLAREKRIDFLERQLSQFFWPLYLQLQKNNVVWRHLEKGTAVNESIKEQVDSQLRKSFFLPNHETMLKIIETNVHLAQPDPEFEALLLRFVRHITLYWTIRDAGLTDDPIAVGEPWPEEFFAAVESRLRSLQEQYDRDIRRNLSERRWIALP